MAMKKLAFTNGILVRPNGGGVPHQIEVHGDLQALMERLAAKAANNRSGKTTLCHGLIKVVAKPR
jgi:hypothetical protein